LTLYYHTPCIWNAVRFAIYNPKEKQEDLGIIQQSPVKTFMYALKSCEARRHNIPRGQRAYLIFLVTWLFRRAVHGTFGEGKKYPIVSGQHHRLREIAIIQSLMH
jgi:hypothetical protein